MKNKSKKNQSFPVKKIIVFTVLAIVITFIGYSLYATFKSGAVEQGLVVCPEEDKCFWQAHIHAYAPIKVCGEEIRMPVETGALTGPHSHEEKNVIHWHDRIAYAKSNQKILDLKPFTLGAYFDALQTEFAADKILDKKNGDLCNGKPGSLKMFVNGKENSLYRDFVWKDKDVIVIVFDERSPAEVEQELKNNPVAFPVVGRE